MPLGEALKWIQEKGKGAAFAADGVGIVSYFPMSNFTGFCVMNDKNQETSQMISGVPLALKELCIEPDQDWLVR